MKYIYLLNEYKKQDIYEKLGIKNAFLSSANKLSLPIPPSFSITTDACNQYYKDEETLNSELLEQINEYIIKLEKITGKKFGSTKNPLLLSIKSSSRNTIPNILESIQNIGLTESIVENLSKDTNNFIWIWECYLELIKNYSKIIMGTELECYKNIKDILENNTQLNIEELRNLSDKLKKEYKLKNKTDFPDNSLEQLHSVIKATYKSWDNKKANIYRNDTNIPFTDGISINIQSMVFGNLNKNSGTGTLYTRDPITGDKVLIGNFIPQSLNYPTTPNENNLLKYTSLYTNFPEICTQLENIIPLLETHYKDMLKIDFVIEDKKLFITQIERGKRTAPAALKIACDFYVEQSINNSSEETPYIKVKKTNKND